MKLNWLILTDHTTHRESNSLYALADAIRSDTHCGLAWICTRGLPNNADFFAGMSEAPVFGVRLQEGFTFANANSFFTSRTSTIDPASVDAVLIRMPQPVQRPFLYSLKSQFPKAIFINDPIGIYETASKKFLLELADLCPPVQLVESTAEAIAMSRHAEIVLKPLYSYCGSGMFRLSTDFIWEEDTRYPIRELNEVLKELDFPMLAMRYLPRVTEGDKRTIVINNQIIGSALRLPGPGSWMCNISHGGSAHMDAPDADEMRIESILTPMLFEKGIVMYGFDTLVNDDGRRVLSEINTLSVGGLMPMEVMSGKEILSGVSRLLYEYVTAMQ
jgi:glutathione synthase